MTWGHCLSKVTGCMLSVTFCFHMCGYSCRSRTRDAIAVWWLIKCALNGGLAWEDIGLFWFCDGLWIMCLILRGDVWKLKLKLELQQFWEVFAFPVSPQYMGLILLWLGSSSNHKFCSQKLVWGWYSESPLRISFQQWTSLICYKYPFNFKTSFPSFFCWRGCNSPYSWLSPELVSGLCKLEVCKIQLRLG